MPAGLLVAIALLAEASSPAPASAPAEPVKAPETCAPAAPTPDNPREIVVCAERPPSYRLDPDVLEAKRAMRRGKPKRPERLKDTSCAIVGAAGCIGAGAGVDLMGGAMVLATMVGKAARGENVGAMFVTDPQRSEYELYLEAKREREEREAQASAALKAKAAAAARAAAAAAGPEARP